MINTQQTPTIHAALEDADEALARLPLIPETEDGKQERIECIRRIARAEKLAVTAYDESHSLIVAQIKDNLDLLNKHFGPLVNKAQECSNEAKIYLREIVTDEERSLKDEKWLLISYTKPTIQLVSKDVLRGYIIAHPEAVELVKDVPSGTRVTRWRLDLLDE